MNFNSEKINKANVVVDTPIVHEVKYKRPIDLVDRAISSSALKKGKNGIKHLLAYYNNPSEIKGHFEFGNAAELKLIDSVNGTDEYGDRVIEIDTELVFADLGITKLKNPMDSVKYKNYVIGLKIANVTEKRDEEKYFIPMKGDSSAETITELVELAKEHPYYHVLKGNYQDPFIWDCEYSGLKRYARTDIFNAETKVIVDIKTDSQDNFSMALSKNDYWFQALDQMKGAVASGKMDRVDKYYWFVLTNTAPYAVDIYELPVDRILKIEEVYGPTLENLGNCIQNDLLPPYALKPLNIVSPPNYYK